MLDTQHKNRLIGSLLIGLIAVMVIAVIFFADREFNLHLSRFGVYPRDISGLKGILFYPLIHGSLEHLFNNSVPLFVLLFVLFYFYPTLGLRTVVLIYFLSGMWIWISARQNFHIGASGVVYGLASFLFFSGMFRKDNRMMALSMMVAFLYGSMVWGIFPFQERVSWEGHLWGAVSGLALAFLYRKQGPQPKVYQWQIDEIRETERLKLQTMRKAHPNVVRHPNVVIRRRQLQRQPKQGPAVQYTYVPRGGNHET